MPSAAAGADLLIPGSISNLGPGFDTLAVAVRLYVRARIVDRPAAPATLDVQFVGAPPAGENRIDRAFRLAVERFGPPASGVRVEVDSEIPMLAGLGSSGAATIAGLRLYEAATSPRPVEDWLSLGAEIEGHPDNVAPALFGGFVGCCQRDDGRVTAWVRRWPEDIRFVVATPDVPLETPRSRSILPERVDRRDAVFNLQRALLLLQSLEIGNRRNLREALRDRLHQPYRAPLVPGLAEALALEHPALLGVCLSGAGPSVVALADDGAQDIAALLRSVYDRLGISCTVRTLAAQQPFED